MRDDRHDDARIENLPLKPLDDREASQVKGGFNPQPDPPKIWYPTLDPGLFYRLG